MTDAPALASPEDALALLARLGAPARLVQHHRLVLEAARLLADGARRLPGKGDPRWGEVLIGAALHDAGKIVHPAELAGPGSQHEAAGEALLLGAGVGAALARFCRTHAAWQGPGCALEDRLVALADKLWKGKREAPLEEVVCRELAELRGVDFWKIFVPFDALCEQIAAGGAERLAR